jgi:hypothetical protein
VGWVVFIFGCLITIPIGWALFSRGDADRLLSVIGLILLPPTIWGAGIALGIGPCDEGSCVTHQQKNLLWLAVVAVVLLVVAFVLLYMQQRMIGGGVMLVAAILGLVSVTKIDKVLAIAYGLLAASIAAYVIVQWSRSRPEAQTPDYPPI